MKYTSNLNLKKPEYWELADIEDINENMDVLDEAVKNKADKTQVLTNVPANAKFTDTIYTHPSTHPASMITESTSRRFVSDAEKATWNGKANLESPTFTGTPKTTANTNYTTAQLRNIRLYSESETIPALADGEIALIYSTAVMP